MRITARVINSLSKANVQRADYDNNQAYLEDLLRAASMIDSSSEGAIPETLKVWIEEATAAKEAKRRLPDIPITATDLEEARSRSEVLFEILVKLIPEYMLESGSTADAIVEHAVKIENKLYESQLKYFEF